MVERTTKSRIAFCILNYSLMMDVLPLFAPADTEHGIETPTGVYLSSGRATTNSGWAITTACSEEKLLRILPALDWFYTAEGSATRSMGLSAEQGAGNCADYIAKGVPNGARENGSIIWTKYGDSNVYPLIVAFTAEESEEITRISTNLQNYAHPMTVNFIMGREELTEETFKAYQAELVKLGLNDYLQLKQQAYDRFAARSGN